ncbi:Exodeoxyribonuclease VII large subunit [Enhydrobacter aerosaccus]|uniref:Exodeoxyribonuclease 7 large subunit n=1 Tax=Enhydrobacter aerosaccus TaxID=225324 RepID=A0A1T4S7C5_9HYPH|nr:exodeoxyribonuclease VII large subunit [Enhydrobacter aerosaccus]SKA24169.1 Exodeoxyribonuclease VII large subunit [Enhydrobacter aerosaccus]
MEATAPETTGLSNVPEFSVSELSFALKRQLEGAFPRVRVRGEISQPSFPRSGHCYFRLKDENAVLDGVCWKGTLPRLGIKIEEGMEVIATGKITTYAGSSRYQIIIDRIELAGEGALLKLLEDRRRKLAAEGLFDAERKRALPFLPEVVGVVTSPSGAVIRDILHRLSDRFPRHVLVWPVAVQGDKAAGEVAAAIAGFNKLPLEGPVPRPDILIVARGGGSLEDLWAFNEEIVVRAAAASTIPLISAVGHETDTTLIDFASDRRAPTPTAAAEMAVPVRADLLTQTLDFGKRTIACMNRALREANVALSGLARGLGDPLRLIEERQQRLDVCGERLALAMHRLVERRDHQLAAARLASPLAVINAKEQALVAEGRVLEGAMRRYAGDTRQKIERTAERLEQFTDRVRRCTAEMLVRCGDKVDQLGKLLESYSFHSVLNRGFALVRNQDGHPVLAASGTRSGDTLSIEFADGRIGARVTDGLSTAPRAASVPPRKRDGGNNGNQGSLL